MDGNVLRGTAKAGARKSGIRIVTACSLECSLVLGQEKVGAKSNEGTKTALPDLLRALDLRQALVSCDAAGCQRANADLIVAGGGHYLLALKKNLPVAYEQVDEHFAKRLQALLAADELDFGSGRAGPTWKRTCPCSTGWATGATCKALCAWTPAGKSTGA